MARCCPGLPLTLGRLNSVWLCCQRRSRRRLSCLTPIIPGRQQTSDLPVHAHDAACRQTAKNQDQRVRPWSLLTSPYIMQRRRWRSLQASQTACAAPSCTRRCCQAPCHAWSRLWHTARCSTWYRYAHRHRRCRNHLHLVCVLPGTSNRCPLQPSFQSLQGLQTLTAGSASQEGVQQARRGAASIDACWHSRRTQLHQLSFAPHLCSACL